MNPDSANGLSGLSSRSKSTARRIAAAAGALFLFTTLAPAFAQTPTLILMRAMPAKTKRGDTFTELPPITKADIAEVKIGGKVADVTDVQPLLRGPHGFQLVILLDSMEQIGINDQFDDIKKFMADVLSAKNTEIAVGYLLQSHARIVQPFTTDKDLLGKALVKPTPEEAASPKNDNGNPYSCLRDLAANWPTPDPNKLRGVLMITDGIERNNAQAGAGDQLNPDVAGTSEALQHAGIQPYPFYYLDPIPPQDRSEGGGPLEGMELFSELDAGTGGVGLYAGMFAPGSFFPLLNKLYSALDAERVVTVNAPGAAGKEQRLDIKSSRDDIKIFAPDQVLIGNVLKGKK
jgi:hypothetical protein